MKFFNQKQNKETRSNEEQTEKRSFFENWNPLKGILKLTSFGQLPEDKSLKLSVVYRCIDLISSSIAVLPFNVYKYDGNWKYKQYNSLYNLLNYKPNSLLSKYIFFKTLIQHKYLKGNAYIDISRRGNDYMPVEMKLLDPDYMTPELITDSTGYQSIIYKYQHPEYGIRRYNQDDIIHIINYPEANGLLGMSTLTYAQMTLDTAYQAEQHANKGRFLTGLLTPKQGVNVSQTKADKAKEKWVSQTDPDNEGNSIMVLDGSFDYQPVTVSPKDAQLLESRAFNVIEICRYFSVPPSKVFDLSKSSYASQEASQIDFLNSTLLPIVEQIENEFFTKIFAKIDYNRFELKLDTSRLLRMDSTAQSDYFTKMIGTGVMTVNEARQQIDAPNPMKGGNRAFVPVNLQPLDRLFVDNQGNKEVDKSLDNNLKSNENGQ